MKKILGITLILFCICFIIYGVYKSINLQNNHVVLNGAHVDASTGGGKFHAGSYFINFSFYVNKQKYAGSSLVRYKDLPFSTFQNYILGRSFPVVFDSKDTSNSTILILPHTFSHYGYAYPDSLEWVLKYISN